MMSSGPFYSVYGVGPYTFSSFKVVWREVASKFLCAAVGPWNDELLGLKPVVPDHKLILVDLASWEEAAYVSGLLNSSPVQLLVTSYSVMTQVGTHVLEYVAIPAYNPALDLHVQIAHLSTEAHMAAAKETASNSWDLQARLDELAARLWGLTPDELSAIHRNLAEIGGEMEAPATDEAASTETK